MNHCKYSYDRTKVQPISWWKNNSILIFSVWGIFTVLIASEYIPARIKKTCRFELVCLKIRANAGAAFFLLKITSEDYLFFAELAMRGTCYNPGNHRKYENP